jgi:hypothetical protein
MKKVSANGAQELTAWVLLATYGLVAPARERIKREIEAHYAEAVDGHLAEGLSRNEAEAVSLLELGEIRDAAKAFRKRHLTEEEVISLHGRYEVNCNINGQAGWYFWYMVFITCVTSLFLWSNADLRPIGTPSFFAITLWSCNLSFIFSGLRFRYLAKNSLVGPAFWRKLLVLELTNSWSLVLFWQAFLALQVSSRMPVAGVYCFMASLLCIFGFISSSKNFRVWRKLRYDRPDAVAELKA